MNPTVEQLQSDLANYCITHAQEIATDVKYTESLKGVTVPFDVEGDGAAVMPNFEISGSILQAFQDGYFPAGNPKHDAETAFVARFGVDHTIFPKRYYDKYLMHLRRLGAVKGGQLNDSDFGFTAFIVSELERERIEEMELDVIFSGFRIANAFEDGKVNPAKYHTDGYRTTYKKWLKAGKILAIDETLFPLDVDSAFDYLNEAIDMLQAKYRMKMMNAYTSPDVKRKYAQKKKQFAFDVKDRENADLRNQNVVMIDDSNTSVSGHIGMQKQRFVLISPIENMVEVNSRILNPYRPIPDKAIKMTMDYGKGFGIRFPKVVFGFGEQIEAPVIVSAFDVDANSAKFKIEAVAEATAYVVDIDNNADFSSPVVTATAFTSAVMVKEAFTRTEDNLPSYHYVVNSQDIAGLSASTVYYARIRSKMTVAAGADTGRVFESSNSAVIKFTTTA